MKKAIFILLVLSAATAQGQTLKELLFSGKLKKDSSGIIRKTDDLKSKIDTTTKKQEAEKPKVIKDSINKTNTNKVTTTSSTPSTSSNSLTSTVEAKDLPAAVTTPDKPAKTNTKIWKEYTDSLVIILKNEILSSKKIKKETYFFTVEYEIGSDGKTNITNVTVTPENAFLASHANQRISDNPPLLNPVFNSAGQPQKVKRRQNFYITKD